MANESHILLAACSSQEYAHEGPFEFAGHFTTALLEVLRAHSFQKLTYRSLWHRLVMPPFGPPQTPHCEGKFRGRRLFDCQENGADWEDILCRRRWDRSSESKYQIFEHDLLDGSSTVFETAKVKSTSTFTSILELVQASDAFLADSVLTDVDGSGAEDALTANPTTQRDAAASSAPNTTIAHAPNQSEGVRYARLSKDVGALLRVYCRDKAYIQSVVNEGDKGPITVVDEPDEADLVVKLDEGKVKFEHAPHTKVIEPAIVARGMSMSLLGTVAADNSESSLRCARSVVDSYGRFLKHLKRTESPPVSNILQLSFRRLQEDTLGNWEPVGKNLLNENSDTITIIPDDDSYYGLTLTNLKKLEPLFVHIFFFQPKTASIMLWYRPPQSIGFVDTVTPNSLDTALEPGRTLAAGFGNGGVHPFCFPVDPDTHIDVSIVKIFASTAPTDMSFLAQASPFKVEASVEEAEEVPFEKLSSPRNTQSLEAQFFDDADDDASSGTRTLVKRKPEGLKGNGGVQGLPAPAGFWMTRSITFIETSKPESGTPTASGEEVPAFAPVPDPQIVPQCPPKNMDIQEAPDEEGEAVAASRKVQYADQ
ncbi:hypothetical protein BDZ89DRAFT_1145836 [Hymenopellis radicata]|nr:hypothetical protein BDZ89DRAFT_1145836 [Hymenopellis radicata]